jgi:hypothetical protein
MFDSISTGLLWFVAVYVVGGISLGAIAAVARA